MTKIKKQEESGLKKSAKELKWQQHLNNLILFRRENPDRWPQYISKDEGEKKLAIWCQSVRLNFRKGSLEESMASNLKEIGFNFQVPLDNWKVMFEKLKNYLEINKGICYRERKMYYWAALQNNKFHELSLEKQQLLNSINLSSYFVKKNKWMERFTELERHILIHKNIPTITSNPQLSTWLHSQKEKYKQGKLRKDRKDLLAKAGIDFSINKREDIWNAKYESVIKFRQLNHKMPSCYGEGEEKVLYQWGQTQRQVMANTAPNRKSLSQARIDKLNKIGFKWSLIEMYEETWNETFQKLVNFIQSNGGSKIIPTKIDGKYHSLYQWVRKQKIAISLGRLSPGKTERLKSLGIISGEKAEEKR